MARCREAVAVIGEGITEIYYIKSLGDVLKIKPMPFKPTNSSIKEFEKCIKDCIRKGYTRVFCLIDMDNKVMDGNPDHQHLAQEYRQLKRKHHRKIFASPDGGKCMVEMIESFPATEVFFQFYFGYTSAYFTNQGLKHKLNQKFGYSTEERYLQRHSLHDCMTDAGGSLLTAIDASKRSVSDQQLMTDGHCYSEIGLMIEQLQLKCKC